MRIPACDPATPGPYNPETAVGRVESALCSADFAAIESIDRFTINRINILDLPIILLPVGVDDDALDACLAALDAGMPADSRVWLADDAQSGPRGYAIIERWIARTPLRADYTRRPRAIGQVAHLDEMLKACGDADVIVLAPDAIPTPRWATQLAACFARDASIATATPWCNAGETAAWPRCGEVAAIPADPERIARAAATMPPVHPELPAAVDHAVMLRGSARRKAGGLDAASYASWYAALIDCPCACPASAGATRCARPHSSRAEGRVDRPTAISMHSRCAGRPGTRGWRIS